MNATPPIRVMLVDGHALVREALSCLLANRGRLSVTGDAGSLAQALALYHAATPDVVLLRPSHEAELTVDAIPHLLAAGTPPSKVLVLTDVRDPDLHDRAIRNGARGIVRTQDAAATVVDAIHRVHEGEVWLVREPASGQALPVPSRSAAWSRVETLTRREREVVRLVAEGLKNKQIGARLSISDVTVRHHLTSVFAKLGVRDRLELVIFAFRHGLAVPGVPSHRTA